MLLIVKFELMKFLATYTDQIKQLCKLHHVRTLFAFGSVVADNLKPSSDIDFLVDIDADDPLIYSDHYFDLKFQLEHIFQRPIDLLEEKAIKNPFLKNQINQTKAVLYER